MAQPFLGEIRLVGFNFAPQGWAFCDGSLLGISEYEALFVLIGTTYGGDGQTTFGLPDLRGRVAIHQGNNGTSTYVIGQDFGEETVSLTANQMPEHTHPVVVALTETERTAGGHYPASTSTGAGAYGPSDPNANIPTVQMDPTSTTGLGGPHENRQPFLAMNYVIALLGIFPSQN
jgi:microcystin-dependent protein